jgi:hypothetical protein
MMDAMVSREGWHRGFAVCAMILGSVGHASAQPGEPERHLLCFAGRPLDCASVLLLEFGYRTDGLRSVTTGDFGLMIHSGYDALGATVGFVSVSEAKADAVLVYAARYRRYIGRWGVAGDVSIGVSGDGLATEVALGWADVLAITAGANTFERDDGGRETIFTTGIRVGSVPIGGLFYATALILGSARR